MGRRLTLNELLKMQDDLDLKLLVGSLGLGSYLQRWDRLLVFAGWTQPQYEAAIDARWRMFPSLSPVPRRLVN